MAPITFVTGNRHKFTSASAICAQLGVPLVQQKHEIDEIQGLDGDHIALDKAAKAFAFCKKPIVIVDDIWDIVALRGFPGPYMKDINSWFEPDDFLRLMKGVTDRRIFLRQHLVYRDASQTKIFQSNIQGTILHEARGTNQETPEANVVALDCDNGLTIAEVYATGLAEKLDRYIARDDVWFAFAEWYRSSLHPTHHAPTPATIRSVTERA